MIRAMVEFKVREILGPNLHNQCKTVLCSATVIRLLLFSHLKIDMKKMPLGKLSRRQMETAYSVLSELQKEISGRKDPSKILDGSNRFYTLIPHDFGIKKPPLLDSDEVIKLKTLMVDNLLEIELAYSLLKKGEVGEAKDPLDVHYEQLKTDMEVCYIIMCLY